MIVGVWPAAVGKMKREMNVTLNKWWGLPRPIMLTNLLNPYMHTILVTVTTCNYCVWNVRYWMKEMAIFGGRGHLFIIFVDLGTKWTPLFIFFCFHAFLTQSMLLLQLSFSQIYHVFAVPSEMMEVLDTTTKYISTNEKRQTVCMQPKDLFSCTIQKVHGSLSAVLSSS